MEQLPGSFVGTALKALKSRLGGFVANVLVLMGGTAVAQVLLILATPLITRLYSPVEFGLLAIFDSMITLVLAVASGRYEWAIVLPEDEDTAANLLFLCLALLTAVCLACGVFLWFLGPRLLGWLKTPLLQPFLWLVPLGLFAGGAYQALTQWSLRQKTFATLARTRISQGIMKLLFQVGLGLGKIGVLGLLLGNVAGRSTGFGLLAQRAWRQNRDCLQNASLTGISAAARRYKNFPLFLGSSALLNAASLQLPSFCLAALYGPQVLGWFALGQKVFGTPTTLIGEAVSQVFSVKTAEMAHKDLGALQQQFYQVAKGLLLISLPIGILTLAAPWLVPIVFGAKWQEAGIYIQLLSLPFLVKFIAGPTAHFVNQQLQHWRFCWDISRFAIMILFFVSAYFLALSPRITIFFYGVISTIFYAIILIMTDYAIRKMMAQQI